MYYLKKIVTLLFTFLALATIVKGQYYVSFTDGEKWNASIFIEECEKSMRDNEMVGVVDIEGLCICMVNKFADNFTWNEFAKIAVSYVDGLHDDNYWEKAREFYSHPKIMKINEECFAQYLIINSDQKLKISSEAQKEALSQYLKDILLEEEGIGEFMKYCDIDKYCDCLVENYFKEFSSNELFNIDPEDPKVINIQNKCALKSRKPEYK